MAEYNHNIERWWSLLGLFDRCQICGIPYDDYAPEVLTETDEWWNNLSYGKRKEVYEDFFAEY